jgi:DtxR family manganese transport transcriptional regulator
MKKNCERAKSFAVTREQHLSEIAEDYVEIISDLLVQKGKARTCDIAELLGVSHVTVVRTLARLTKQGYVESTKEEPIQLTEKGTSLAYISKERHLLLFRYLIALGVPKEIAVIDTEGMEHHISPETLAAFKRHLELLE